MSRPSLEGLNLVYPSIDNSQQQFDLTNPLNTSELDAQLDLWTNLAFHQDEPLILRPLTPASEDKKSRSYQMDPQPPQSLDLNNYNFFNQFSIDPFLVPPASSSLPLPNSDSISAPPSDSTAVDKQPSKRQRSVSLKKSSSSDATSPTSPSPSMTVLESSAAAVSAAEDKRKRNTAASARFRAKKKEREAALERKSKDLETRVSELERECESLRRENGWLKGLVVGVTGASAGAAPSNGNLTVIPQGTKRRRVSDEDEEKPPIPVTSGEK